MCLIFKCIVGAKVAQSIVSRDRDSCPHPIKWQIYDSSCGRQQWFCIVVLSKVATSTIHIRISIFKRIFHESSVNGETLNPQESHTSGSIHRILKIVEHELFYCFGGNCLGQHKNFNTKGLGSWSRPSQNQKNCLINHKNQPTKGPSLAKSYWDRRVKWNGQFNTIELM